MIEEALRRSMQLQRVHARCVRLKNLWLSLLTMLTTPALQERLSLTSERHHPATDPPGRPVRCGTGCGAALAGCRLVCAYKLFYLGFRS
jgi:hypothetical protein